MLNYAAIIFLDRFEQRRRDGITTHSYFRGFGMSVLYPAMQPVRAELRLDLVDSSGNPTHEMRPADARPLAVSVRKNHPWFSFCINDTTVGAVLPGTAVTCSISFINHVEAMEEFPRGASVLFGDGAVTKGVLRLE
ncbi:MULTISPECIES: hypothetical protein [Stenotrophomonas]|uniref:hypothetical protein n=1 Tax=Stenotrophomonas sp. CFBP8994 TaxID=3096527 RepID=UPI002A6AB04D|nr:hypothetical protein [Stenotrophomonas sp. CFBP8994]MDY0981729.1 hypothetical protein [Stenotrophomonas sp. CFBP8994]